MNGTDFPKFSWWYLFGYLLCEFSVSLSISKHQDNGYTIHQKDFQTVGHGNASHTQNIELHAKKQQKHEQIVKAKHVLYDLQSSRPHVYSQKISCPVSSVMDLNGSENHIYPIDIYGHDLLHHSLDSYKNMHTQACVATELQSKNEPHNCSYTHRPCPLYDINIADATHTTNTQIAANRSSNSFSFNNLCSLKTALADASQTVNVIVLGTSVTYGVDTLGCCATQCPTSGSNSSDTKVQKEFENRCAWPKYFGNWLKQVS